MTVFEALGDPTRRSILERLRTSGPLSVTDLAAPLPMTRQAVTKHLDILQSIRLVRVRRRGRERLHELDPLPLKEVEEWLAPYAAEWDRRLARLRTHLSEEALPN
jgi:DNA-binding transcriptional ArsR family regulator